MRIPLLLGITLLVVNIQAVRANMQIGQNLDSVTYHSTAPAFGNAMKMARPWMTRSANGTEWESGFGDEGTKQIPKRSDGYPLYVPFSVNGTNQWVHTQIPVYENGSHRIVINGAGTVSVSGPGIGTNDHIISGSKDFTVNISGTNNLASFDSSGLPLRNEPSHIYLVIKSSSSSNPIRDVRVMRPGYHSASKDVFDSSLLTRLAPFTTIRFMDWQRTNNQSRTTWAINENSKEHYTQATTSGVALAHCLDLANQLSKHIWLCVPHALNDAGINAMAEFVAANVPAGRIVYIEYSNEHWNDLFTINTQFLPNAPFAGANIHQKYGTRSKFVFDTFHQKFQAVGKASQLRRTLAGQAVNPWIIENALAMAGTSTDVLAIAPYFGTVFASGLSSIPSFDQLASETYVKMNEVRSGVDGHRALAQNLNKTLVCYEGGQHYVGAVGQENNNALTSQLVTFNRDWRMRNLYRTYLNELNGRGVNFFANFSLAGRWSKWGSWGTMEYWNQTIGQNSTDAVKAWAVLDWLANPGSAGGTTPPPSGGATNLALNQPASASSTESGRTPAMANDGSGSTRWAASGSSYPQWWEVDLGSGKSVTSAELTFEGASAWKYRIEGRASTTDAWTTLVDRTGNTTSAQTFTNTLANGSNKRYVRVTITGYQGGYFWASLFEVKVFGTETTPPPSTTNLALNKPASASTTEAGKTPAMGNDGSGSTRWAASGPNFPQWWEVDLGSGKSLSSAELTFEGASAWKYRIEGRASATDGWTTLVDRTGNTTNAQTFTNTLSNGSNKRYVRVTITGYQGGYFWASLFEVKVNGQ